MELSKSIDTTNAIGITSTQGKGGDAMAHPFITCDFEMWNDSKFRYEVLMCFTTSGIIESEIDYGEK